MKYKYVIKNVSSESWTKLEKDAIELFTLLGLESMISRLAYNRENESVTLHFPPSIYKAIKKLTYELMMHGKLINTLFADKLCFEAEIARETKEYINAKVENLAKEASKLHTPNPRLPARQKTPLLPTSLKYENLLKELYDTGVRNIVIAEDHSHISPKKFIIDNINILIELKAVIVMENLTYDTLQDEIDRCINTDKECSNLLKHSVPFIEKSSLHPKAQNFVNIKLEMIQLLCKSGINIIAGDTEASNSLPATEQRLIVGNYIMINNKECYFDSHPELAGRLVIYYTGLSHAESKDNIMGIAEITNSTLINVIDTYSVNHGTSISLSTNNPSYNEITIVQEVGNFTFKEKKEPTIIESYQKFILKSREASSATLNGIEI